MENLSKREHEARQKAAPGWDDRVAEYDQWLNLGRPPDPRRLHPASTRDYPSGSADDRVNRLIQPANFNRIGERRRGQAGAEVILQGRRM
ncbi:hypothetical protein GCM10017767_28130 [Halomonas urumqiensis]|nr:hypothetical protein GCM10017767_28130 [Halomonas urumqiensis]